MKIRKYICNIGRSCFVVGYAGRIGGEVEIFGRDIERGR